MNAPLTGIELLRAMIAGAIEPVAMAQTLGFTLKEVSEGAAVFEGEPSARILNPMGIVHGGWAMALIDSACGCAAHTTLPAGVGYTTVETKTNFARAIKMDTGTVRAEGHVVAAGRAIITAEARIYDAQRRVLAHGTSTLLVLRKE